MFGIVTSISQLASRVRLRCAPIDDGEKYNHDRGYIALKTVSYFLGLLIFVGVYLGYCLSSPESPFPLVRNVAAIRQITSEFWRRIVEIALASTLIVHIWRVFAGFSFAQHDPNFLAGLKTLGRKQIAIVHYAMGFFILTYPLLSFFARTELIFWAQVIWGLQGFVMLVLSLLVLRKITPTLNIIADFLMVFCSAFVITAEYYATSWGLVGMVAILLFTCSYCFFFESVGYCAAIRKNFRFARIYLASPH